MADTGASEVIIIKKYANRRLYDTSASAYVTLEHLSRLVREGRDFVVQDARSGEDITRSVLAQIIFEQENRDEGVLPISFLRQIIQFYGESVQSVLPSYLEMAMNTFVSQQEKWRQHLETTQDEPRQETPWETQIRLNMQMFEEAMRMFTPYRPASAPQPSTTSETPQQPEHPVNADKPETDDPIAALQAQMTEMQKQIAELSKKKS